MIDQLIEARGDYKNVTEHINSKPDQSVFHVLIFEEDINDVEGMSCELRDLTIYLEKFDVQ